MPRAKTNTSYWRNNERNNQRGIYFRHLLFGADLDSSGNLRQKLQSEDAGDAGILYTFFREKKNPQDGTRTTAADNDYYTIAFASENDASTPQQFSVVEFDFVSTDVSDGSEDGRFVLNTMQAGTMTESLRADANGVTIQQNLIINHINTETLAANKTLAATDETIQFLDPGGAGRTITLPAEASSTGLIFIIANRADAAEDLTVNDDGASTIVTISQNECGFLFCDGTTWEGFVGANT